MFSCSDREIEKISHTIQETKEAFAPDARTAIFDLRIISGNPIVIAGETNIPEARKTLIENLKSQGFDIKDKIILLPDSTIGEKTKGVINVSVANLRSNPRHSAELVTQALLGTPVNILKDQDGWLLIQTPDQYIAWTNSGSLVTMDNQEFSSWKQKNKIIYLSTVGFSVNEADEKVSDLVVGNVLEIMDENDTHWIVKYPDERKALISKSEALKVEDWLNQTSATDSSLAAASKDLMGTPYLWGGTSTKGVDCSGFTKTVYLRHGLVLPRDASQQVYVGELVDSAKDFSKLKVGDLLFFGRINDNGSERVVHVGLWLGNNSFIHSSGDVHISSMDSTAENFDEYNYDRYLRSKRVLGYETSLPTSFTKIY